MRVVYTDLRTGSQRIHVEILADDMPDLLDDTNDFDAWPVTLDMVQIIKEAQAKFRGAE